MFMISASRHRAVTGRGWWQRHADDVGNTAYLAEMVGQSGEATSGSSRT